MKTSPKNFIEHICKDENEILDLYVLKRRSAGNMYAYTMDTITHVLLQERASRLNMLHDYWYGNLRLVDLKVQLSIDPESHNHKLGMPIDKYVEFRDLKELLGKQLTIVEKAMHLVQLKLLEARARVRQATIPRTLADVTHQRMMDKERDNEDD